MPKGLKIMQLVFRVIGQEPIKVVILHHLNALDNIFVSGIVNIEGSLLLEDGMLLLLGVVVTILVVLVVSED